MKTKHYWKVVSVINREFVSALETNPKCKLKYKVGEVTYPKIGKIFVFLTRESARDWKDYHVDGISRILKVKAIGKVEKANAAVCVYDGFNRKKDFWKDYLKGIYGPYNCSSVPPINTYYADAVLPVEIA